MVLFILLLFMSLLKLWIKQLATCKPSYSQPFMPANQVGGTTCDGELESIAAYYVHITSGKCEV